MSTLPFNALALLQAAEGGAPDVGFKAYIALHLKSPGVGTIPLVVMVIMSVWMVWIIIDRWMLYSKAKTESLQYIPLVTKLLKENKLQEAIDQAKRYKNSHIAKVVSAALMEFKVDTESDLHYDVIEAARRSIERVSLRTATEMKTGLGVLATIGASGPFVGLFGTVLGIIHAFAGMAMSGSGGIGSVAGGIAEALWTTALGLGIAIPAVWMFNKFSQDTDKFQVEMSNSSSELVDYFIKHNPAK